MRVSDFSKNLVISAEIHYFRLNPESWKDRIMKAKSAGCNAISSYIPWIVHEECEGNYRFDGWYDLNKFVGLVEECGMLFIARPGPFVMAELKNEGLPYWIYEKYPHIVPITWEGKKVENATVVYNHPDFLNEVKRWYSKVIEVLRSFLERKTVIGIQMDNEIGMLQWVNNTPDLSDFTLSRFVHWVTETYGKNRYNFSLDTNKETFERLRSPDEDFRERFIADYSEFIRIEFSNYVRSLTSFLVELGVDTNFLINIHGTGGGRAHTFPIGVSQLELVYQQNDVIPTTDIYLGTFSVKNFHDLWNINEFIRCTNKKGLYGSMEFECGDGNYGNDYGERISPESVIHKLLLSVIQGNKIINYYLFAGGVNPKLESDVKDGNGRIAFTGELHGFAAPVKPNGETNYSYDYLKKGNMILNELQKVGLNFSDHSLVYDDVLIAYIPEYYQTEYHYKDISKKANIEIHRGYNFWDNFLKGLLLAGFRYEFVHMKNEMLSIEKLLIVPTAKYLPKYVQEKVSDFINKGGKVLLYGDLPIYDEYGQECTILIDTLGIRPEKEYHSTHKFFLSVSSAKYLSFPEFRTDWAREVLCKQEKSTPIAYVTQTDNVCGLYLNEKNTIVLTTHFNCNPELFKEMLSIMNVKPKCEIVGTTEEIVGVYPFLLKVNSGEYLIIMNIEPYEKTVSLKIGEEHIGEIHIQANEVKLLKLN